MTTPTSLQGTHAAVAYLSEWMANLSSPENDDFIDVDDENSPYFHVAFLQTIAEALAKLPGGQA